MTDSAIHLLLTHENADFDAAASLLAAYKLYPDAVPLLPERQNRNVARFLALYRNGLPLVRREDYHGKRAHQVTLLDTQRIPPNVKGIRKTTPIHVIDHHPLSIEATDTVTLAVEPIGATTTLLIEQMQAAGIGLNSLEATLLALGIYEDTGALTYRQTTPRDLRAAAWLIESGAALDQIRRFLEPPLTDEQQAVLEQLITTAESRTLDGHTVLVGAVRLDEYLSEVNAVAHRLRDTLDPSALFLLVEMPRADGGGRVLHLVCRSTDDAIDAGEIARLFGGGGHERAAAATIYEQTLEAAQARLWAELPNRVHAAARIADLMSHGVQTLEADAKVETVIRQMRRIGHEGFPVVENGRVVGLLTRRDADRATEHGLGDLTVREIMVSGVVTLNPDDSVSQLEQTIVESGWGQVPVVNHEGRLLGIVTRTDLIKHWGRVHPARPITGEQIDHARVRAELGAPAAELIAAVGAFADDLGVSAYFVGGTVRDLILGRSNLDIDFVVEQNGELDGIALAGQLKARYGGGVSAFKPFGTAKWKLDEGVASALGVPLDELPDHVDFATARNEFYEHPTALPTVYSSSIKLDLARRDFTINTLAVQISPAPLYGRVLDFYGGLKDVRQGLIRVLHSLSFVDDPTRILRAVRFEQRLNFQIEKRTAELITTALPMLRRITGERVRNELTLLLRESEPERGLLTLAERGILRAIHPQFVVEAQIAGLLQAARALTPETLPWSMPLPDPVDLGWRLLGTAIPADDLPALTERLLIGKTLSESMIEAARLIQSPGVLQEADARPSRIAERLDGVDEMALLTAWLVFAHRPDGERARLNIEQYMTLWRAVRPATDGHALMQRGLKPGPCFRLILDRLRAARLDGEAPDDEAEARLLQALLDKRICHDDI